MKKKLCSVLALSLSLTSFFWISSSAEDKTVNATITPLVISLEVSATSIDYGTKQANSGEAISSPELILVKNSGTVPVNFRITGANSTSGDWLLAAMPGTNEFVHRFATDNSNFTDLTTDSKALRSNVPPGDEVPLYMWLIVPTSITKTAVQTLPIKITALQP